MTSITPVGLCRTLVLLQGSCRFRVMRKIQDRRLNRLRNFFCIEPSNVATSTKYTSLSFATPIRAVPQFRLLECSNYPSPEAIYNSASLDRIIQKHVRQRNPLVTGEGSFLFRRKYHICSTFVSTKILGHVRVIRGCLPSVWTCPLRLFPVTKAQLRLGV